jgi:DNA-binding XRE family transcriptional regulator
LCGLSKKKYYNNNVDFETFRNKLGKKIKQERTARGLTQEDMDDGDDGVPHRTMQNIETGRSNPNLRTIFRLSKRMNISVSDLMDV